MARTPRPDGWTGGSEDFDFVRTLDGHRGVNVNSTGDEAVDAEYRRNAHTPFADLDGA